MISVCSTPGYNVSECLNGIQHSQNDVIYSLSMGLCETGRVFFYCCVFYDPLIELSCLVRVQALAGDIPVCSAKSSGDKPLDVTDPFGHSSSRGD